MKANLSIFDVDSNPVPVFPLPRRSDRWQDLDFMKSADTPHQVCDLRGFHLELQIIRHVLIHAPSAIAKDRAAGTDPSWRNLGQSDDLSLDKGLLLRNGSDDCAFRWKREGNEAYAPVRETSDARPAECYAVNEECGFQAARLAVACSFRKSKSTLRCSPGGIGFRRISPDSRCPQDRGCP